MCITFKRSNQSEPQKIMKDGIWGLNEAQSKYVRTCQEQFNAEIDILSDKNNLEIFKESLPLIDGFRKLNGY